MPNMSTTRSMSFPISYMTSMPAYLDSHYIHGVPAPMMNSTPPHDMTRASPQSNVPPSPASSADNHRVSKARKGKRVHACEYPGCPKIFTRAEHRRRHELSHKAKKTYVCTYEGCEKAFHRADYLTQHMARHEPNSPKEKSPSVRSSSTCSSLPGSHALASTSPVIPGFHSPATNASTGTATSAEPSIMGCFNCQSHSQPCIQHLPFYQYSSGMNPNSVSSVPLLSPQSTAVPMMRGFDSAMDQYLRSVLRPEAFITPPQPQENIESSFWGSNIDPNLSQVNPSAFQNPTSYPWTSSPDDLASSVPAIHHLTENHHARPDHDS